MRFQKGVRRSHPPRGPARHPYRMSERARKQRLANLKVWRSRDESVIILSLIRREYSKPNPRSLRVIARELGVSPSYVWRIRKQTAVCLSPDSSQHYALDKLAEARRTTAKMQAKYPNLYASKRRWQ